MEIQGLSTLAIIVGIASSLFTQGIKREKAGSLENVLLAGIVAVGLASLSGVFGSSVDLAPVVVSSFAWHGLTADQVPMSQLKFAAIDRLLGGVGKAFQSAQSTHV